MPGHIINVIKKYDESLKKAHSEEYKLSIQLSPDGFSFSIFNSLNSKFLSIESVETDFSLSKSSFIDDFTNFVKNHEWLSLKFSEVQILYEGAKATLVPTALFNNADKDTLAMFNFEVEKNEVVQTDFLKTTDAHLIYTLPLNLHSQLKNLFPDCSLVSHSSVLIEILMILNKNHPSGKGMFVNVRKNYIDILLTKGKQLLLFNSFKYTSKEDFIYYIIYVIEQLNLNPEEVDLKFSGIIDKESTLYDIAWKYVRNIHFQDLSRAYTYSYIFNDVPGHYFFTLLNSGLCES